MKFQENILELEAVSEFEFIFVNAPLSNHLLFFLSDISFNIYHMLIRNINNYFISYLRIF